jgi:hypothetical protein
MLRNILILVCFFILTGSENKPKWKSLFNGKDLKGWEVKIAGYPLGENFGNTFRVENGYSRQDIMRMIVSGFGSALCITKKFLPTTG